MKADVETQVVPPLIEYWYGATPPAAPFTLIAPVDAPLQLTFVTAIVADN